MPTKRKRGDGAKPRGGRKTLYTAKRVAQIISLLSDGCIIDDVCAKVGISSTTYYEWAKSKPEFADKISRAQADAKNLAAITIRTAMKPHQETSKTTKTFTETRIAKGRDEKGQIIDVPYEYTKVEQSSTVTHLMGDWRAALEYLKRRDPDNWSERLIVQIKPEWAMILDEAGKSASDILEDFVQRYARAKQQVSNAG